MTGQPRFNPRPLTWVAFVSCLVLTLGLSAQELIKNAGFEDGTDHWFPFGPGQLTSSTTVAKEGARSGYLTQRSASWNGVAQALLGRLQPGETYFISAWFLLENSTSEDIGMTILQEDSNGAQFHGVAWGRASDETWTQLHGSFTLEVAGEITELMIYFEGPPPGVSYYVDDVSVQAVGDWREEAAQGIEEHRKREVAIQFVNHDGEAIRNAPIVVEQLRHHFGFGSAINNRISSSQYRAFFAESFEWAVMENESKWYSNEPNKGELTTASADRIVAFCRQNGISLRGHTIFWCVDDVVQDWIKALPMQELQTAVENRLGHIVPHFAGTFLHWDVNNEMLHGDFFQRRLGAGIRPWMFQRAHELDPEVLLFTNDFGVVSGGKTDTYIAQIRDLIEAGAPIHGIGVQCHFGDVVPFEVRFRLDKLAELGLPIWCTEFDVEKTDPGERADHLEAFYRTAFSHPGVNGILMWGFWAGSHWRGPDAAIVDLDWRVNAAGQRYLSLMEEWTTYLDETTDDAGSLSFRGFHGTYEISAYGQPISTIELFPGAGPAAFVVETPAVPDCNENGVWDVADIANGTSGDCNEDSIPDECQSDCNANGKPDDCDLATATSRDCNGTGVPDECELAGNDCDQNGVPDQCDISSGLGIDCNQDGILDACQLTQNDCDADGILDECQLMGNDCNANGMLDECDIKGDASADENANGTPDECEVPPFRRGDCNDDGDVDIADPLATLFAIFLGEFEIECDDACDSNDDETVNVSDVIATLGVLFLGNGVIPLPGMTECGVDPTEDGLSCESFAACP